MFNVVFSTKGNKNLKKLPKDIQKRILAKIIYYSQQEDPVAFAKPLINLPPLTHRFRVGDYRIAFYVKEDTIVIERIEHRKDIYTS